MGPLTSDPADRWALLAAAGAYRYADAMLVARASRTSFEPAAP
jgi:hypothetical protein